LTKSFRLRSNLAVGHKAVLIARFIPVVRAFPPFVAGIAMMPYRRCILFNVEGLFGCHYSCLQAITLALWRLYVKSGADFACRHLSIVYAGYAAYFSA